MSQIYTDPQTGRLYEVGPDGQSRWVDQPAPVQVPVPEPYRPLAAPYQAQPEVYQPQPNGYQPQPTAYQAQPDTHQPQTAAYQAQTEAYRPKAAAYQGQPEAYRPPEAYQPHAAPHPVQTDAYRSQPDAYRSQQTEAYPQQTDAYRPQTDAYQPQPDPYQPQSEPYQPQSEPYRLPPDPYGGQSQPVRSARQPQPEPSAQSQPAPQFASRRAPQRKGHALLYALIGGTGVIIVIVAIVLVYAVSGGSNTATNGTTATAPSARATKGAGNSAASTVVIARPVKDGKFEFTVTGITTAPKVGNDTLNETAQGTFVLVSMKVRNIGNQAQLFNGSAQKFMDAAGRKYSSSGAAAMYLGDQGKGFLTQINPGNAVNGTVVFDVPHGTKLVKLELHDSPFSGGVTVAAPVTAK